MFALRNRQRCIVPSVTNNNKKTPVTDSLIGTTDIFLNFFIDKKGIRTDKEMVDFIKNKSIDITLIEIVNLLVAYNLIERSKTDTSIKYLTPEGFKAAKKGMRKYLKTKRQNEFVNELWFKIIVFTIPTVISIVSACFTYSNYKRPDRNTESYYTKHQVDSIISTFKEKFETQENSTKSDSTKNFIHNDKIKKD